jgi:hypothetical protein
MRQQPVITHADAQAAGNPPQKNGDEKCLPGEKEQRSHCPDVKQGHEDGGDPINFGIYCGFSIEGFEFHAVPSCGDG